MSKACSLSSCLNRHAFGLGPEVIAREIVEDLEAALSEFATVAETLTRLPEA